MKRTVNLIFYFEKHEPLEYYAQALNLRANSLPWEEKFENLMLADYNFAF